MVLITKSDCMSATDLSQTVRYICHVVDFNSKLPKDFHDTCLFSVSDQLVVGNVFSCIWLKNYKNKALRYSMTVKQYFCVEETYQPVFSTMLAICLKLNDELMCLTDSVTLNVKKCREYMQEGEWKVGVTGSRCFHNTFLKKNRPRLLTTWRNHTLSFFRKLNRISVLRLGHRNLNHIFLHYWSIPS